MKKSRENQIDHRGTVEVAAIHVVATAIPSRQEHMGSALNCLPGATRLGSPGAGTMGFGSTSRMSPSWVVTGKGMIAVLGFCANCMLSSSRMV